MSYPRVRLRAVAPRPPAADVFVAPKPSLSGEPGSRLGVCVAADVQQRGNKTQLVLTFETVNDEVGRMWIEIPKPLSAHCRYVHLVRLALGRELTAGEAIRPEGVFVGRWFTLVIGYRKSQKSKGGRCDDAFAMQRKDERDFLRVLDVLNRLEGEPIGRTP